MGQMRVLDETGDTLVEWRAESPVSLEQAEGVFNTLLKAGRMAFARPASAPASEAVQIKRFDATADEIIWVRPLQGG